MLECSGHISLSESEAQSPQPCGQKVLPKRRLLKCIIETNRKSRMLFEFHSKENARRPGSVHATYLVSGGQPLNKDELNGIDDDVHMRSSPFFSSSMPSHDDDHQMIERVDKKEPLMRVVTLVREDQLEGISTAVLIVGLDG